jgi:hypothetical protein
MAMTPEILLNYSQLQKLRVTDVVYYLRQNHWVSIDHPNPRFLVFEKGVDDFDKPIQIVLPNKDDYEDTPYLLTKVVNLLSVLESMSFQEMVDVIVANISDH